MDSSHPILWAKSFRFYRRTSSVLRRRLRDTIRLWCPRWLGGPRLRSAGRRNRRTAQGARRSVDTRRSTSSCLRTSLARCPRPERISSSPPFAIPEFYSPRTSISRQQYRREEANRARECPCFGCKILLQQRVYPEKALLLVIVSRKRETLKGNSYFFHSQLCLCPSRLNDCRKRLRNNPFFFGNFSEKYYFEFQKKSFATKYIQTRCNLLPENVYARNNRSISAVSHHVYVWKKKTNCCKTITSAFSFRTKSKILI